MGSVTVHFAGAIPINFRTLCKYPPAKTINLYRLTSGHFSSTLLQRRLTSVFAGGYLKSVQKLIGMAPAYLLQRYLCRRYLKSVQKLIGMAPAYPPAKTINFCLCRRILEKCTEVNRYGSCIPSCKDICKDIFAGGYLKSVQKLIGMAPAKISLCKDIFAGGYLQSVQKLIGMAPAKLSLQEGICKLYRS